MKRLLDIAIISTCLSETGVEDAIETRSAINGWVLKDKPDELE